MNIEDQVSLINQLITRNYDAEEGYQKAAEKVETPEIKSIFEEYSKQRNSFGHELKSEIKKLGGEVEKGTSLAADAHRIWIDLKALLASNEDQVVLNEVIRGESYALDSYAEALKSLSINTSPYDTILNQRNQIRAAKERMESLEVIAEAPVK